MTRERLILDNRSSKPLYESIDKVMDIYVNDLDRAFTTQSFVWGEFVFWMIINKASITIQIYDNKEKDI